MPPFPNARTTLFIVIGNPVKHSLSPALHNAAFRHLGLNCIYLACPVEDAAVGPAVGGMRALALGGANVTSPHKEAVIPHLDEVCTEARLFNSVNTIVNREGRLYGYSTDGPGFIFSLREEAGDLDPTCPVLLVGAGGAARPVCHALAREHGGPIYIANRSQERGEALAALVRDHVPGSSCQALPLEAGALQPVLERCGLIIFSLPGENPVFEAALEKSGRDFRGTLLYDLRYDPPITAVMSRFTAMNGRAVNGLGMLFGQAVAAFELFTSRPAPVEIMRQALQP